MSRQASRPQSFGCSTYNKIKGPNRLQVLSQYHVRQVFGNECLTNTFINIQTAFRSFCSQKLAGSNNGCTLGDEKLTVLELHPPIRSLDLRKSQKLPGLAALQLWLQLQLLVSQPSSYADLALHGRRVIGLRVVLSKEVGQEADGVGGLGTVQAL